MFEAGIESRLEGIAPLEPGIGMTRGGDWDAKSRRSRIG
jgi:hypothetical protein